MGKPYKFIGFGDIYGPKPYKFIGFGDIHGPKPYKFIGFGGFRRCGYTDTKLGSTYPGYRAYPGGPGARVPPERVRLDSHTRRSPARKHCCANIARLSGSLAIRNSDFSGFRLIFGQTWAQNPSRTTALVLQCRLHQKPAPQTNSKAISLQF